ncbi:MAG: histidine phosphatase family protein [Alphaproteobacteria bacterium]|nr:histidine phosphatase family protein [Alphaproteobacteria bacterium]
MIKDFYIFRHGESTYNIAGKIQGQTNDSELTDLGKEQAENIGKKLKNKGVEIIVTSPLFRAVQTAELVNRSIEKNIVEDNRFTEVDVGVVEGMNYLDVKEKYSKEFEKMHSHGIDYDESCYPDGETRKQVRARVFEGLEYWAANDKYKTIAVSSHGIMLSQILFAFGDFKTDIPNGAILHIRKKDDIWSVVEWL